MFTSIDKALVAAVMAVIFVLNEAFGAEIGLDEETVRGIVAALTPLAVYFWPNKK